MNAQAIRSALAASSLNSPGVPPFDGPEELWNMADIYRRDYVRAKQAVARVLQPSRICEIGVYSGIAAMCFLGECPTATYLGIDNLVSEQGRGIVIVERIKELLAALHYEATILIEDSQSLSQLPGGPFDLIHVDGNHTRDGARHDVVLAWQACSPGGHILIDNAHDVGVCAGTFDALDQQHRGLLNWLYLDEGVGNILIEKEG
jgi:predicted O-methyltransferase YrrM